MLAEQSNVVCQVCIPMKYWIANLAGAQSTLDP